MPKAKPPKPQMQSVDRVVFEVSTPGGKQTIEATGPNDLSRQLVPLLGRDPRTAQSVGFLAFAERGTIVTPQWSVQRMGRYTYETEEPLPWPDRNRAKVQVLAGAGAAPRAGSGDGARGT